MQNGLLALRVDPASVPVSAREAVLALSGKAHPLASWYRRLVPGETAIAWEPPAKEPPAKPAPVAAAAAAVAGGAAAVSSAGVPPATVT